MFKLWCERGISCLARATGRLSWRVSEKIFNEAEEIASLDMGARNQYSSINFLGWFIEGISIVNFSGRFLHCCVWLRGKLVEYPRLLITCSPRSLNNFWNLLRCAKCKSPLHGPRNYVDRTCEQLANSVTVHAPFLVIAPNQNATLHFVFCTIDPQY